jgi:hypothetical protein
MSIIEYRLKRCYGEFAYDKVDIGKSGTRETIEKEKFSSWVLASFQVDL